MDKSEQLLNAALKVFGAKGYLNTQISDIIKEAGVARGTFYLYYKSKREIFSRLLDFIFDEVRSVVETLPRDARNEIPSKIQGNLSRVHTLLTKKPEIARVLLCESVSLDPECDKKLKKFYKQLLDLIERAVRQGQEMGFVREGNSIYMAIFLLGTIKEMFYQQILGILKKDQAALQELFQTILSAVAKPEFNRSIPS